MAAVRLLVAEVGIAESRMTVSTSGIVPGILRFAAEKVRPKLAISLNASNNAVRERIMPLTRKWDIGDVLDAVRQMPLRPKERVTFEYVLLGGVNDRQEHADEVVLLLRRSNLPAKVNLIVWNPAPTSTSKTDNFGRRRLPAKAHPAGNPRLPPQASRSGHLRRLRAVEADGELIATALPSKRR